MGPNDRAFPRLRNAAREGFEPSRVGSEPTILPLDDLAIGPHELYTYVRKGVNFFES